VTRVWSFLALSALAAGSLPAQTREQAKAFVKQAVEYAKAHPQRKFLEEVTNQGGRFHFRHGQNYDLYIFVYDTHGKVLAHGARRELVGLERWTSRDARGRFWVQEWTNLALVQGSGWTEYMELNPALGNKVMKKSSWVELHKGMVIGSGIYE
jgi:signal transduction histidine kinase